MLAGRMLSAVFFHQNTVNIPADLLHFFTMNVYTHASYDHAEQSMQKILQFQLPEKALKSGWHTNTDLHQIYTRGAKSYVNLHQFMKSETFQKVRIYNE